MMVVGGVVVGGQGEAGEARVAGRRMALRTDRVTLGLQGGAVRVVAVRAAHTLGVSLLDVRAACERARWPYGSVVHHLTDRRP